LIRLEVSQRLPPRAVPLCFLQADAEVLAHPVDGEAEAFVFALAQGLPAALHLPRARGHTPRDREAVRRQSVEHALKGVIPLLTAANRL